MAGIIQDVKLWCPFGKLAHYGSEHFILCTCMSPRSYWNSASATIPTTSLARPNIVVIEEMSVTSRTHHPLCALDESCQDWLLCLAKLYIALPFTSVCPRLPCHLYISYICYDLWSSIPPADNASVAFITYNTIKSLRLSSSMHVLWLMSPPPNLIRTPNYCDLCCMQQATYNYIEAHRNFWVIEWVN